MAVHYKPNQPSTERNISKRIPCRRPKIFLRLNNKSWWVRVSILRLSAEILMYGSVNFYCPQSVQVVQAVRTQIFPSYSLLPSSTFPAPPSLIWYLNIPMMFIFYLLGHPVLQSVDWSWSLASPIRSSQLSICRCFHLWSGRPKLATNLLQYSKA